MSRSSHTPSAASTKGDGFCANGFKRLQNGNPAALVSARLSGGRTACTAKSISGPIG